MEEYQKALKAKVVPLKAGGNTQAIFGDIFPEDLKKYREKELESLGGGCIFPLSTGILGSTFLRRSITCGENGEFNSFVFYGPVLKYPIPFQKGGIVQRYYAAPASTALHSPKEGMRLFFADLLPVEQVYGNLSLSL